MVSAQISCNHSHHDMMLGVMDMICICIYGQSKFGGLKVDRKIVDRKYRYLKMALKHSIYVFVLLLPISEQE